MASVSLTASGINFSDYQTPVGGMASELLDHYEEGTWSPTSNVGTAVVSGTAEYTRVGRKAHLNFSLTFASSSSNTVQYILGLPWTVHSGATHGGGIIGYSNYTATEGLRAIAWAGNAYISFYPQNSANPELSATNMSGKRVDTVLIYTIA